MADEIPFDGVPKPDNWKYDNDIFHPTKYQWHIMFQGFHRIPFFIKYWDQSHLSHTWVLRVFYVFKQVEPRFEISLKLHDACISSIQKMLTHSTIGSQAVDFQPAVAIYLEVWRRSLGGRNMLGGLRPVVELLMGYKDSCKYLYNGIQCILQYPISGQTYIVI